MKLARLGEPQLHLPPVVHVAGTNGKGSLIAFLRAILQASGRRVHVYTSPHLVRFSERIVVAGADIDEGALTRLLEECERVNAGDPITVFEITTAAAFLAFSRADADVLLLETGLGGRLDATNVLARPALTAITPVSLDHQAYLGCSIEAIAFEKAGILKPGVTCVLARQAPAPATVIRRRAAEVGAVLVEEGISFRLDAAPDGVAYSDDQQTLSLPRPSLIGAHQLQNAGMAIACARHLPGCPIEADAVALGLRAAQWPARLQRLTDGRLPRLLPDGWELWLDGGHNPGAAEVLARHLAGWQDRPLSLVFGMLRSKDAAAFLLPLRGLITGLLAVTIPGEEGSLAAGEAAALAQAAGIAAEPAGSVSEALQCIAAAGGAPSGAPGRVLICGSLYLAGAVLAMNAQTGS